MTAQLDATRAGEAPISFLGGTHIEEAARQLVEATHASATGRAHGTFNGITVRADRSTKPADVVEGWNAEREREAEAYRASPEGVARAASQDAEVVGLQATHDALVHELASINPKDDAAILDWLCRLQPCSNRTGVKVEREAIVRVLEGAGFKDNVNIGRAYRENDRDNAFRYLVGQALDG